MKMKIDSLPSKTILGYISSIIPTLMSLGKKKTQGKGEMVVQKPREAQVTCLPNETSSNVHVNRLPWCWWNRVLIHLCVCVFHAWISKHISLNVPC